MSSFSVICWQEVLVVCVWKHCQMGRVLCQDVAECNVYWNWWREYWLKLPRARNRLVLTERDYSSSQCFWNTGAYLTSYRLFYDYVHVVRLNNGIMFHCQTVKYKALKVDPVQSHFVSQYDGGQLGQRDLWHLSDQSFFFTVTYYLPFFRFFSIRDRGEENTPQLKPLHGYPHLEAHTACTDKSKLTSFYGSIFRAAQNCQHWPLFEYTLRLVSQKQTDAVIPSFLHPKLPPFKPADSL